MSAPATFTITQGQNLTFSGVTVSTGASIEWDFDYDGVTFEPDPTAAGQLSPTHRYAAAGQHYAAIRATNSESFARIRTVAVDVQNVVPTAAFSYAGPAVEGSPVIFTIRDFADVNPAAEFDFLVDWTGTGNEFRRIPDGEYTTSPDGSVTFSRVYADGSATASFPVKARVLDLEGGYTDYSLVVQVANQGPTVLLLGETVIAAGAPILLTGRDASHVDEVAGLTYYISLNGGGYTPTTSRRFYLPDYTPGLTYDVAAYAVDKDGSAGPISHGTFYTNATDTVIDVGGTEGSQIQVRWGGGEPIVLGLGVFYFGGMQADLSVRLLTSGAACNIRTNANVTLVDAAPGVTSVSVSVSTWAEAHESVLPFGSGNIGPIYLPAGSPTTGPSLVSVSTLTSFAGVTVVGASSQGKSWTIADNLTFGELTGPISGLDRINNLLAPDAVINDLSTYEGIGTLSVWGINGTVRTTNADVCPPIGMTATIGAGGVVGELRAGWLAGLTARGDIDKLFVRKLDGTIRHTTAADIDHLFIDQSTPTSSISGSDGALRKVVYGEKARGGNLPGIEHYGVHQVVFLMANKTLAQRFKEKLPGDKNWDTWELHHMIPDAMKKRLAAQNPPIDVDKFSNLRLVPKHLHNELNDLYDGWKRARMKEMGLNPITPGHERQFWNTVEMSKVNKLGEEVEGIRDYTKCMIKEGANLRQVNAAIKAAGDEQAQLVRKQFETGKGSRLAKILKNTGTAVTGLAIFSLFSDGTAMAKAIATDPPEAQAAWRAFDTQYDAALRAALNGGNISYFQAHNLVTAFNNYLVAIKTPEDTRNLVVGGMRTWVDGHIPSN